jgi:hypothetical protein
MHKIMGKLFSDSTLNTVGKMGEKYNDPNGKGKWKRKMRK